MPSARVSDRSPFRKLPLLLLGLLSLASCLPSKFVIDLAGSDGRMAATTVLSDPGASRTKDRIALIDVEGLISHTPGPGLFAGSSNAVDEIVSRLRIAEQEADVRGVILAVNSPGGTVAASETIYAELRRFRARTGKPVVVAMSEIAASGGYYISLAADRVFAQPSTITGSIGVIIQTLNFSKGMAMIGIESRAVKSGPMKDLANPFEPIRDEQYAVLQSTVDDFYASFRDLVRERRPGIEASRFESLTDGRILTGRQALEAGLVDELGGLREAFESAKRFAGIDAARLVKFHPEGRTPMSPYSLAAAPRQPAEQASVHVQLPMPARLALAPGFYYLWSPEIP